MLGGFHYTVEFTYMQNNKIAYTLKDLTMILGSYNKLGSYNDQDSYL
jgi:hypothetical protein